MLWYDYKSTRPFVWNLWCFLCPIKFLRWKVDSILSQQFYVHGVQLVTLYALKVSSFHGFEMGLLQPFMSKH